MDAPKRSKVESDGRGKLDVDAQAFPLVHAAQEGQLAKLMFLLDNGTNVDLASVTLGLTSLQAAASAGHSDVVQMLLDRGASTNVDYGGRTALVLAVQKGHLEVVKLLLSKGALWDYTPVWEALKNGHTEILALLLDSGASVDATLKNGTTLLTTAAQNGNIEIIKLLLERGATVDYRNQGNTALSTAAEFGHVEIVELLLSNGASIELVNNLYLLHDAVKHVEVVKLLLDKGADINLPDDDGWTPIHAAAVLNCIATITLLLDRGVSIDSRQAKSGSTPLLFAAQQDYVPTVSLLLERGANIELTNNEGIDALGVAVRHNSFDVLRLFLEKGEMLNESDCEMALGQCLQLDRLDIAELLIQTCPQIAKEKPVALILTAQSSSAKSLDIMKLLIELGAPLNHLDTSSLVEDYEDQDIEIQQTVLHTAVLFMRADMVWQLVLHGADTSIPYIEGSTSKTVWQMCGEDKPTHEALLHFWTAQTHQLHPQWVKDAIFCVLLIAKRQKWPFDHTLMLKLLSHVAFGWYSLTK